MGQKTNPIGARLGIIRGWESNWYGSKKDYAGKLIEDNKIRTYLNARINKGGIAKIVIERTLNKLIVTIHTSKPGIIIGKGGGEVDRIKEELKKLTGKDDVQINILEIRRPELDANIVGDTIARQIENRINYKRAIKMAIASALRMGAEGIKIKVAGRLGGAEIARTEEIKQGRTPLHTLRMDIDYANVYALTVYGKIGIKVWICKGEVLTKRDLNPNFVGGKSDVSDRRDRRDGDHGHRDHRDHRDDRRGGGDRGGDRGRSSGGGDRRSSGGGGADRRPGSGDRRPGGAGAGGDRRPGGSGAGGDRRPGGAGAGGGRR
jgi:small subunit ribosomal protein S3